MFRKVDIVADKESIRDILKDIFDGYDIKHVVYDRQIILTNKEESGLLDELQQLVVTGKVIDATTKLPLPGVNIVVSGTTIGAMTDGNGSYSITLTNPNGSPVLLNVPLIRLAETYLIRAEVYGRQGNYASAIADLNVLRSRAAFHVNENRSEILVKYEPGVLSGSLSVPAGEKVTPYKVTTDTYSKITIDGTEWQGGTPKAAKENYPVEATTDAQRFIHFIYNERARELIFEEQTVEDLHNAGILYERVRDRDMMGAPLSSTGTTNFPFPDDDLNVALGAMVLVKDNCKNSILLNHGLKVILIC